jgi:hypothetical protein
MIPLSRPRYFTGELVLIAGEGQGEGKMQQSPRKTSFFNTMKIDNLFLKTYNRPAFPALYSGIYLIIFFIRM